MQKIKLYMDCWVGIRKLQQSFIKEKLLQTRKTIMIVATHSTLRVHMKDYDALIWKQLGWLIPSLSPSN